MMTLLGTLAGAILFLFILITLWIQVIDRAYNMFQKEMKAGDHCDCFVTVMEKGKIKIKLMNNCKIITLWYHNAMVITAKGDREMVGRVDIYPVNEWKLVFRSKKDKREGMSIIAKYKAQDKFARDNGLHLPFCTIDEGLYMPEFKDFFEGKTVRSGYASTDIEYLLNSSVVNYPNSKKL
jgi:hypothetical protein